MYQTVSHLHVVRMYRHLLVLAVILLFLLPATSVQAQNPEWIVYNSSNSGLPKFCAVYDLAFGARGTLWIGTNKGLVQFDGTTWTTYTTENSGLPSNQVTALVFDAQETLWVGTDDGLTRFNGKTWTVYTTENSGLPYNAIHELVFDAQGTLWIGTGMFYQYGSGGLAKFDGATWTVYTTRNSDLPGDHIIGLVLDAQGTPWVGTAGGGGVAQFDGATWTVYTGRNSKLPWGDVPALAFDNQRILWIGTSDGVARFDGTTWTVYTTKNSGLPDNSVHELVFDAQGKLWVGTQKGLAKFDGTTWTAYTTENSGLPGNWIWTLVPDTQGNIWMGTSLDGLAVYREGGVMHPAQKTDPESVLRNLFEALNIRDVEGALAFVADDAAIAVIESSKQFKPNGKEEIRDWWEHVLMDNTITEVSNFQVDGDKATWFARVWVDPWRALGVAPLNFDFEGIVQSGLLKSYTLTMTDESRAKLQIAENKAVARRWVEEIWNKGDLSVFDEIVASDYVDRSPAPGQATNQEAIKSGVIDFRAAFPDAHFTIDTMIAEGDKVVVPQTFTGTHQGELHGASATGNQVSWQGIFIYRIKDGKIVERWGALDTLGFMIQIGAVPPPGESGK